MDGTVATHCNKGHLRWYTGKYWICKICRSAYNKEYHKRIYNIEYRQKYMQKYHNPENRLRQRNNHLKREFGIDINDYNEILQQQNHACAICKTKASMLKRKLAVDHNHSTGKVRGLLCRKCNSLLVMVVENYSHLIPDAITYLNKYEPK